MSVKKIMEDNRLFFRLGFVPDSELVALYNIAFVFVMPSLYEGFGLPILEAMSCGCSVVTSREGSLREIGKDSVYYVDPYNANDIADGIGEIYFNENIAKEFSQKGLKQAKKFSWEKAARETISIYRKVLQ